MVDEVSVDGGFNVGFNGRDICCAYIIFHCVESSERIIRREIVFLCNVCLYHLVRYCRQRSTYMSYFMVPFPVIASHWQELRKHNETERIKLNCKYIRVVHGLKMQAYTNTTSGLIDFSLVSVWTYKKEVRPNQVLKSLNALLSTSNVLKGWDWTLISQDYGENPECAKFLEQFSQHPKMRSYDEMMQDQPE